jgi:hypothetical protein
MILTNFNFISSTIFIFFEIFFLLWHSQTFESDAPSRKAFINGQAEKLLEQASDSDQQSDRGEKIFLYGGAEKIFSRAFFDL